MTFDGQPMMMFDRGARARDVEIAKPCVTT